LVSCNSDLTVCLLISAQVSCAEFSVQMFRGAWGVTPIFPKAHMHPPQTHFNVHHLQVTIRGFKSGMVEPSKFQNIKRSYKTSVVPKESNAYKRRGEQDWLMWVRGHVFYFS
jgi:hypothetical protein